MVELLKEAGIVDCLVISANQVVTPYPVYPLGAACLVTALRQHGHQARHFDILADGGLAGLASHLAAHSYDLVGISIRNIDSVDSADPQEFLPEVLDTVSCVRKHAKCPVVLGGPAFSIMPETLLEMMAGDYGVVGEGEELLPYLATEIGAGRPPVEKLFYSEPTTGLWQPSELSPSTVDYYIAHGGMLNVQTKRGCPYTCSYCSYPLIEGAKLRYRDPDEVAEEVVRLRDNSGARYIFFADSFFNDPEGRFLEVAEALIRRNTALPWCGFFRPENLHRSDLQLLKRAGLAAMEIGTDGATDQTLAGLGKGFTFDEVVRVHERIIKEEIPCAHFVMFGGPEENEATLQEGLANLDRLETCVVFGFAGVRILPGTGIFTRAVADKIIDKENSLLAPTFYFSPAVSREKVVTELTRSFHGRLDRIYPCHEFEQRIATLHAFGHIGPLWDLILNRGRRQ